MVSLPLGQAWLPKCTEEGSPHFCPQTVFLGWRVRGKQENECQRKWKLADLENYGREPLVQGHWLSPDPGFPMQAFQLPQASLVISGRAASLQNKIKFNSLRRSKNKVAQHFSKGQGVRVCCKHARPQQYHPSRRWFFSPVSPLQTLTGPSLTVSSQFYAGWVKPNGASFPHSVLQVLFEAGLQYHLPSLTPNPVFMPIPTKVLKYLGLRTPLCFSKASRTPRTCVYVGYSYWYWSY